MLSSVNSLKTLIRNRSPLPTIALCPDSVQEREAYLFPRDNRTREGRGITVFPNKDGTKKCQQIFGPLVDPDLPSCNAVWIHTMILDCEVGGNESILENIEWNIIESESIRLRIAGKRGGKRRIWADPKHEPGNDPRYSPSHGGY